MVWGISIKTKFKCAYTEGPVTPGNNNRSPSERLPKQVRRPERRQRIESMQRDEDHDQGVYVRHRKKKCTAAIAMTLLGTERNAEGAAVRRWFGSGCG